MSHERGRPQRHPRVAARDFGDEAVLIDPDRNMVRMLNQVGSRIWALADGSRSEGEIVAALIAEYEVSPDRARTSVREFLDDLTSRELLVWIQSSTQPSASNTEQQREGLEE